MGEVHAQRTPAEEAAERAWRQEEERVNTWMLENTAHIEQAWERSAEGKQSWQEAAQQRWPRAFVYDADIYDYRNTRSDWQQEVRDPAVQNALEQEAIKQGVVTREVAEYYTAAQHLSVEECQRLGIPPYNRDLAALAGHVAYHAVLQQWTERSQEAPRQTREGREATPTREDERAGTLSAAREQQAERSPEMEARGWGQSWDEQHHAQERGRER